MGGARPRRMQELYLSLSQIVDPLSQELGRSPTIAEMAAEVQASEEEVLEALERGRPTASPPCTLRNDSEGAKQSATRSVPGPGVGPGRAAGHLGTPSHEAAGAGADRRAPRSLQGLTIGDSPPSGCLADAGVVPRTRSVAQLRSLAREPVEVDPHRRDPSP